jgi:hydroxymethylglutaryl-CoA reductase (NADPH)
LQKTPTPDILLILAAYICMHITFIRLFLRSRSLGSNFWLPTAIVSNSVLALLISLPIAMSLRIPMDPILLTEALPFVVCIVGFDKPLRLARAVFGHPHLIAPVSPNKQLKPAAYILLEALSQVCNTILGEYALEIAIMLFGANSGVVGFKEICALMAVLLVVDCFMMTTFLVSVLEIMVEVSVLG